jgi:hypothetical protein
MVAKSEISEAGKLNRVTMDHWVSRVHAFLKYGTPSQKALVCEGEAGCGKSEITVQACQQLGLEPVVCPGLGSQQMEEFLALTRLEIDHESDTGRVIQGVLENIVPTMNLAKAGKHVLDIGGQKKVVIPWLIDEIFTGNMGQANQLRSALTFRQIGSVELPKGRYKDMDIGVYILGTTNPEDVIYSSRKSVDAAVMDRITTLRVYMEFEHHQRYLAKLANEDKYPEVCRLFLRMEEQRDLWKMASPRFWTQCFGQSWMELSADKTLDSSLRMILFRAELEDHFQKLALNNKSRGVKKELPMTAEALIARFQNFIEHGDDPHYYPISANAVLNDADAPKLAKQHNYLFDYWNQHKQHNFIGVTVQDLMNVVADRESITEQQASHISGLLNKSGIGLATQFCSAIFKKKKNTYGREAGNAFEMIIQALTNTDVYIGVAKAMEKHDSMVRDLSEQKKRQKLVKQGGDQPEGD